MSEYDMPERDVNDPRCYESDNVESSFEIRGDFLGDFDAVVELYTTGEHWIEDDVRFVTEKIIMAHVNKYDTNRMELMNRAISDLREHLNKEIGSMGGVDLVEVEMD
jgi:hypothetical protein